MIELLELIEVGLVATAVVISVVATPAAILTDDPPPDILPLLEVLNNEISDEHVET